MGLFRKSIKHSKSSKDLDNKIKNLDEDLKKTGVTIRESDALPLSEEKVKDVRYNWRKDLYEENTVKEDLTEEYVNEIREKHRKLALVEDYHENKPSRGHSKTNIRLLSSGPICDTFKGSNKN